MVKGDPSGGRALSFLILQKERRSGIHIYIDPWAATNGLVIQEPGWNMIGKLETKMSGEERCRWILGTACPQSTVLLKACALGPGIEWP